MTIQPAWADLFIDLWRRLEAAENLDSLATSVASADSVVMESRTAIESCLEMDISEGMNRLKDLLAERDDRRVDLIAAQAIDGWYGVLRQPMAQTLSAAQRLAMNRLRRFSRLNAIADDGQVILRRPLAGRWSDSDEPLPEPTELVSDLFDNLAYLPATIRATDPDEREVFRDVSFKIRYLPAADSRLPEEDERLRIGFIPLAESEADIRIEIRDLHDRIWYDAIACDLGDRVAACVTALCKEGAHIIVLPELAVSKATLDRLRDTVRAVGPTSALAFVFAGTRRVESDTLPWNRSIVLDHLGNIVLEQDKLSRWNLDREMRGRLDVYPDPAEEGRVYEYMRPGERVEMLEIPFFGRLAVLVCEDLCRSEPGHWIRSNMLLEMQFTPVLDSSLRPGRWTDQAGQKAVRRGRCRVVISNSLSLTHRQNRCNEAAGQRKYLVDDCGVGLCLDRSAEGTRYRVVSVPLLPGNHHEMLEWDPDAWDSAV